MSINHHPGDEIPVKVGDTIVGWVTEVRATYVLDDQEYTMVVTEIEDSIVAAAIQEHIQTQRPVFSIVFPRTPGDLDHIFKVS
jgi:hypothetical protein